MTHHPDGPAASTAQGLGWLSIGLGLAELLAPHGIARFLGMEGREGLIRAYGAREVATGLGILTSDDPTPWVWGRVGGDVLDLATLAGALAEANPRRGNVALALVAVAGITALDAGCAQALRAQRQRPRRPVADYSDRRGLARPPDEMRGAARDLELPRDMRVPEAMRPYTNGTTAGAATPAG